MYRGPGKLSIDSKVFKEIQLMWDLLTQKEVDEGRDCPMVALKLKGNTVLIFPEDLQDQQGFVALVPRLGDLVNQELVVIKASEEDPTAILSIKIQRHLVPGTEPHTFLVRLQTVNGMRRGAKPGPPRPAVATPYRHSN